MSKFKNISNTEMTKTEIAKAITKLVVRRSVSGAMVTLVHNYCPTETKAQKAQLYVAAWAMGGVVSKSAADWAADKVGDYIEIMDEVSHWVRDEKDSDKAEPAY